MKMKRATIKDVAQLSGVSVATVSRVLSNSSYPVSAEMRDRVVDAAKQLSFSYAAPTRQSQSPSHGFREIALIIPNVYNPFYMQTMQGISSVCYDKKYQLILCNSQWDEGRENSFLQEMYNRKVNGIIISSISENPNILSGYLARGMSVIRLDQRFDGSAGANINYDSRLGAQIAVRHLIEKGHKRIAFASTPFSRWANKELYRGYTDQLRRARIDIDDALVFISETEDERHHENYEAHVGKSLADLFAERSCDATAVFCVNDMVAFGLISGLKSHGKSVPDDVSVIGMDNIPFSEVFCPPLSTISCPAYETGRLSALMLIDQLQNSSFSTAPLNMHLQPMLVERDSVKSLF